MRREKGEKKKGREGGRRGEREKGRNEKGMCGGGYQGKGEREEERTPHKTKAFMWTAGHYLLSLFKDRNLAQKSFNIKEE